MAKKLRVLTDPDFTTKGSPLTKEEADQDLIDIWNATLDGKGVTATAAELNILDGVTATTAEINVLDGAGVTTTELQQVANIDAVTITNTQWGYVGAMDQGVATTDAVTFNGVTTNGVLDVNANIALHDSSTDISTDTFTSGFAGSGLAFLNNGTWDGTLDNLTVRQRMRIYELLINQIRATNGSLVVSSVDKPEAVTQKSSLDWTSSTAFWTDSDAYWYDTYKLTIEENKFVPFSENDLVRAQRFTGSGTHLVKGTVVGVENGSATVTNNTTTRYFLMNITSDSDVPQAGMEFVRWGSLTDADKQGLLYMTSDDDDAPYIDILYGLDSHDKFGTQGVLKGRIGRIDGVIDNDFPSLDGTQTNEFSIYIDGGYFNNVEVRGTITILDTDASNAATKAYVDGQAAGNVIIRATSAPSTRNGGASLEEGDVWIDTDDGDKPYTWNGSSWVQAYTVIDGGDITTGTVTLNKLSFTALTSASGTNDIIATINASTEGITIDADNLTIGAATTFNSGYDPTTKTQKTDGVAIIKQASEPTTRASGDALQVGDVWVDTDDSNKRYQYDGTNFIRNYTLIDGGSLETGTVTADKISVTDLSAVNTSTGALTVSDTLTMGASGTITNADGDFTVDVNGFNVDTVASFAADRAYTVGGSTGASFWGDGSTFFLEANNAQLTIQTFGVSAGELNLNGQGVDIDPGTGLISLRSLPTSNPGGSDNVWNDGGTLKIT